MSALVVTAGAIASFSLFLLLKTPSRPAPYPPGPKGSFLVGSALQIPKQQEWLTYTRWGKTWGEIVSVHVFGRSVVFLNSHRAASDLLEKRSLIYWSRPVPTMAKLAGFGRGLALIPYGDRHRRLRRSMAKVLSPERVRSLFYPILESKIRECLLEGLLDSPHDFRKHIQTMSTSVMMKLTYGYETIGENDVMVEITRKAMMSFSTMTRSGVWLVEFLPALRYLPAWFPGAGFKNASKDAYGLMTRMVHVPYEWVKKTRDEGTAVPSFASKLLDEADDEDTILYASQGILGGGSDTVPASISTFILAITLYPSAQRKAQEEIDRVVGRHRLPSFDDMESLNYVNALMLEVLRWNPVAPLGVAHASTHDDIYEGFFIPSGSVVIANIWAMLHDENTYKDPMVFNPDRFLSHTPENDPSDCVYGFGRRICPGINVAVAELYLAIVQVLAVYTISKAVDKHGREIDVKVEYSSGTISRPGEFQCRIEKRFEGAEKLVEI